MGKIKKVVGMILCVVVLLAFSIDVQAAEAVESGACGTNLSWVLDDSGTLTISGTGAMTNFKTAQDVPWYASKDSITAVVIGEGVTQIGQYSFYNHSNLTSVTIPKSVTSISYNVFTGCSGLTDVCISDITAWLNIKFGSTASVPFMANTKGKTLYIDEEPVTELVIPAGSSKIPTGMFMYCHSLTSVTIEAGLSAIEMYAFAECKNLTSITLPGTVTRIADQAFQNCVSLGSVVIPDSVTSIGAAVFSGCSTMKSATLPARLTSIGRSLFQYCYELADVTIPDGVTSIGNRAFGSCKGLTTVHIPDSVTSLGTGAFQYCENVTSVTIGDGVTEIAKDTFYRCESMTDVTIGKNVRSIGENAFKDCLGLTSVVIPDSVTSIGDEAFYQCKSMLSAMIGDGVTSIGAYAFAESSKLYSITFPASLVTVGDYAFYHCERLTEVDIADVSVWLNISFGGNYSNPLMVNSNQHRLYLNGALLQHLVIPEGTTTIRHGAFYKCSSLASVTIPDSVISIEAYAFAVEGSLCDVYITDLNAWLNISFGELGANPLGSNNEPKTLYLNGEPVTDLVIPAGVTKLPNEAFYTTGIATVVIPDTVTEIGGYAFGCCENLRIVEIPDSVTLLGEYVFYDCSNLTTIMIPEGITTIERYSFYGCAGLKAVFYDGSHEQRDIITINTGNTELTDAQWHYEAQDAVFGDQACLYCPQCDNYYLLNGDLAQAVVEFRNWDGALISSEHYHYRDVVRIPETPVRAEDETYTYTFTGWEPEVTVCLGDTVYTAVYSAQPKFALNGTKFTLSFEDEILVNFYFTAQNVQAQELGMLVFYTDPGVPDIVIADDVYVDAAYDPVNDVYMGQTDGIAAKNMGDTRYYAAYAAMSDGSYIYSEVYAYSPRQYAMNRLEKSDSESLKALCVAMLNYGAAAQEYFGYRTDALMNSGLTAQQQALAAAYDSSLFAGAVKADITKVGSFAATDGGFSKKTATVSFESAFSINYYFTPDAAAAGKMTMYYWTSDDYASIDVMTAGNASGSVTMLDAGSGRYWASITGIAPKALDDTYYVAVVYTDESGNTYCSGVVAYSLSQYCINNAKDGSGMKTLAAATAMYGYYANAYFNG